MKALTIWQPWATLIIRGIKPVENRHWLPKPYQLLPGDPLLIHAGKKVDPDAAPFLLSIGFTWPDLNALFEDMPAGAILGLVTYAGACWAAGERCDCGRFAATDQYHWQCAQPRPLAEPISCRGAQGLWRVPADLTAAVQREVARA